MAQTQSFDELATIADHIAAYDFKLLLIFSEKSGICPLDLLIRNINKSPTPNGCRAKFS